MDMIKDNADKYALSYLGDVSFGTLEARLYRHAIDHLMDNYHLRGLAAASFGPEARFWNCHEQSFDFDQLLGFLGGKGKLRIEDGVVRLGFAPACGGH